VAGRVVGGTRGPTSLSHASLPSLRLIPRLLWFFPRAMMSIR
jgi:hypothetical protein